MDVNEAIREVIERVRSEAMKTAVSVKTELGDDLPSIKVDRVQLQQAVLNLTVNAIQAMSAVADGARDLLSLPPGPNRMVCSSR